MSIFSLTILLIWPYFGPKRGKKKTKKQKKKKTCPFYFRTSFKKNNYFDFLKKIKKKKQKKNRVPSILGLRLKVTVILLIYWKLLQNTKTSVFKQIRELKKPIL